MIDIKFPSISLVMKKYTTILNLAGGFLIFVGVLFIFYCYSISDPDIEGPSGRTPISTYLLSLFPILFGIVLLITSYKSSKEKT